MGSTAAFYGAPRLPAQLVSRPRLLETLAARGALTIVRAPAGGGKTVLLADWARTGTDRTVPGVWLTLDSTTVGRSALWRGVAETLCDAKLLDRETIEQLILSSLEEPEGLRRELVRMFAALPDGLVLVLDSFELAQEPEIHEDLLRVLRNCAAVSVIVATRSLGAFESAQTRLELDVTTVFLPELNMTVEETALALELAEVALAAGLAADVHRATGGLPLAVRAAILALESGPENSSPLRFDEQLTERLIALLRGLAVADERVPRFADFAVRTAIAEVLTVKLAADLSGCDDAAELLDVAEQKGLGLWGEGPFGRTFSYTPVVRAVLLAEIETHLPEERERLWRIAAHWAAQHNHGFSAVKLALEIEDFDLASRFLRGSWLESSSSMQTVRLLGLLSRIPRHRLRKHPLLLMVLALGYNTMGAHRLRALESFALTAAAIKRYGQTADVGERVLLFGAETAALRLSGHINRALTSAETAMRFVDGTRPEERDEMGVILGISLNQIGLTFLYCGEYEKAVNAFYGAYSHSASRHTPSVWHALSLLAGTNTVTGDLRGARSQVAECDALNWPPVVRDGYIGALHHLARAFLALERFDFEAAQAEIDVMHPHLETIEHWPLFAHVQAMVDLSRGRALAAATILDSELKRGARPSITHFTRMRLDCSRALLMLAAGRPSDTERLMKPYPRTAPQVAVVLARRELLGNKPEQVIRLLDDVVHPSTLRFQSDALLLVAAAALRLGRVELASSQLEQFAALMTEHGLRFTLMLIPRSDLEALRSLALSRDQSLAAVALREIDDVPSILPDGLPRVELTERERVVLRQLAATGSLGEIAAALFVSANTVKSQVRSIYRKLEVNSREAALLAASERGLLNE